MSISRKYKPLAIVVFYCLVNGFGELPVVAGLALGYVRRLQVEAILPSDGKVQSCSGSNMSQLSDAMSCMFNRCSHLYLPSSMLWWFTGNYQLTTLFG